ncbi:hypothetical protein PXD04_10240 [Methanosphaera sp. ISO3-F5]|uniref:hypothetical protein n=1 Tax=Methanosphaera sp. ISO3-F5 TaxID=1452353 RepID=UPI002B25EFF2|nr:hypothetical protein [Methanosphaera sp. ISO3-F5]WQH64069.1 hypothetical protein PXD04_10240 [Methanosphaera sp. ISO3-F5]
MRLYVDTGGYPRPEHFANGYSKSMSRKSVKVNEQDYEHWQKGLKDFIVCRVNGENEFFITGNSNWNVLSRYLAKSEIDFYVVPPWRLDDVCRLLSLFGEVDLCSGCLYFFRVKFFEHLVCLDYSFE